MNTEISEIEEEASEPVVQPPESDEGRPVKTGRGLAFLAILVSLTALAGSAWIWWQDQSSQSDGEERVFTEISRLESADQELSLKISEVRDQVGALPSSDHTAELSALESQLRTDASQVERLEQSLSEQKALTRSLQAAAESMQSRLLAAEAAVAGVASMELDAGGELDLAEVDYLLRLANERLKLFTDPNAADEVLELADIHLDAIDNPMYLGVRQEIAAARRQLVELESPDYFAISSELDAVQHALGGLTFRDQAGAPEAPATEPIDEAVDEGWWQKLKGAFSGLVTVRRSTDQENERISLEDRDYVLQRLWLQLEIARLSLMRRDQGAFRHSLARVSETLSTWFDPNDEAYQSLQSRLVSLQETPVEVDVPDISQPWATLRLIREGHSRPLREVPATEGSAAEERQEQVAPPAPETEPRVSEPEVMEPQASESEVAEPEPTEPADPAEEVNADASEESPARDDTQ